MCIQGTGEENPQSWMSLAVLGQLWLGIYACSVFSKPAIFTQCRDLLPLALQFSFHGWTTFLTGITTPGPGRRQSKVIRPGAGVLAASSRVHGSAGNGRHAFMLWYTPPHTHTLLCDQDYRREDKISQDGGGGMFPECNLLLPALLADVTVWKPPRTRSQRSPTCEAGW